MVESPDDFRAMTTAIKTCLDALPIGLAVVLLLACSVNLAVLCRML